MDTLNDVIKLVSFNCKAVKRSVEGIRELRKSAQLIALQETWLYPYDEFFFGTIDAEFDFTSKSAVDTSAGILPGRPYGGVALMWKKGVFSSVTVVPCHSDRLTAIKVNMADRTSLVFSVYMPTDSVENLSEFTQVLSEISVVIESSELESAFVLGDFNAHPKELFLMNLFVFNNNNNNNNRHLFQAKRYSP